jgi:hypothetical protein
MPNLQFEISEIETVKKERTPRRMYWSRSINSFSRRKHQEVVGDITPPPLAPVVDIRMIDALIADKTSPEPGLFLPPITNNRMTDDPVVVPASPESTGHTIPLSPAFDTHEVVEHPLRWTITNSIRTMVWIILMVLMVLWFQAKRLGRW